MDIPLCHERKKKKAGLDECSVNLRSSLNLTRHLKPFRVGYLNVDPPRSSVQELKHGHNAEAEPITIFKGHCHHWRKERGHGVEDAFCHFPFFCAPKLRLAQSSFLKQLPEPAKAEYGWGTAHLPGDLDTPIAPLPSQPGAKVQSLYKMIGRPPCQVYWLGTPIVGKLKRKGSKFFSSKHLELPCVPLAGFS